MGDFLTSASSLTCPHGGTVVAIAAATEVSRSAATRSWSPPTRSPSPAARSALRVSRSPCVTGAVDRPPRAGRPPRAARPLTTDSVGLCLGRRPGRPGAGAVIQATQTQVGGL